MSKDDIRLIARAMGSNIESREIADGIYQHAAKETPMQWTAAYPTKPGYYWMRNYLSRLDVQRGETPDPEPRIAEISESGDIYLTGDEVPQAQYGDGFASAEWYGPIEPPE